MQWGTCDPLFKIFLQNQNSYNLTLTFFLHDHIHKPESRNYSVREEQHTNSTECVNTRFKNVAQVMFLRSHKHDCRTILLLLTMVPKSQTTLDFLLEGMHMNQEEKKIHLSLASFLFWSSSSNLSLALLPIILFLSASYCLCVLSWWMLRFKATFTRAVISFIAAKAEDRVWLFTCSQEFKNIASADPYSQKITNLTLTQSHLERHFPPKQYSGHLAHLKIRKECVYTALSSRPSPENYSLSECIRSASKHVNLQDQCTPWSQLRWSYIHFSTKNH